MIRSEGNEIFVEDIFDENNAYRLIAAMHNRIENAGYTDLILNFEKCAKAFAAPMLMIIPRIQQYWMDKNDVELKLPEDPRLSRLFHNANWAHIIDPRKYDESRSRNFTHSPAIKFKGGTEQQSAVDRTMDVLMAAVRHLKRDEIRYIEWAVNEITDNVINHSQSKFGGIIQVTNHRHREQIEITVCDGGLGITKTLRDAKSDLATDTEALELAIKEGVTRDISIGQGNGLYGTWRISQISGGELKIYSRNARLVSSDRKGTQIRKESIPVYGSTVNFRIGYSDTIDLSDALMFKGERHVPIDYIETHFQEDENGNAIFIVKNEVSGFGSRAAGNPARRKLVNLVLMPSIKKVVLDWDDVPFISSSFADELVGKLFVEVGPMKFMSSVSLINVDPLVKGLIDKAITQRMSTGL